MLGFASPVLFLLAAFSVVSTAAPPPEARAQIIQRDWESSSPCRVPHPKGTIQILDSLDHGNIFGFISHGTNPYGGYATTQNASEALHVMLLQGCDPADPFQIAILDIFTELPFLGTVVGLDNTSDNITPDSANHAYVAGTWDVPRGPAQIRPNAYTDATGREVGVESAVWTLPHSLATDAPTALIPSWVNANGLIAAGASLVYVPSADGLVLTGNVADFAVQFGSNVQIVVSERTVPPIVTLIGEVPVISDC
ncbi:hypothetical protein C8Q73DRAFT_660894 [Cubamyces lactineus]|nr:hypothetical protein C8Q73DRAFT_660894 [Cubamyces lactineus]